MAAPSVSFPLPFRSAAHICARFASSRVDTNPLALQEGGDGPADAGGGTADAAAAATVAAEAPAPALEFGWVPADVVHALLGEVGNFRARAAAIELLHAAVLDVPSLPGGAAAVLPSLSAFLAFLLRLVADANFKIAISAMTILEDLVAHLGADLAPYLGTLAAALTERLGDNVQVRPPCWPVAGLAMCVGGRCEACCLELVLLRCCWEGSIVCPSPPPTAAPRADGAPRGGARAGGAGAGGGPRPAAGHAGRSAGAPGLAGAGGGRERPHRGPAGAPGGAV